ncbi:MAG: HAD family hydrolase [Pirellulales bacterium]
MLVCLFDIDGTLLHSSGAGRLAMDEALADLFGVTSPIQQDSISGRTDRSIATDQFRKHGIADTQENFDRFIDAYIGRLPDSMRKNNGTLCPGIDRLVAALLERPDTALGLLTGNVQRGARIKLGHCGIDQHFAFGAYGDVHRDRDDVAREAFGHVQSRFGDKARPDDIWVLGDTPWDVRCAKAVGVRSIAVATGIFSMEQLAAEQPDLLVPDFSDVAALWDRWG